MKLFKQEHVYKNDWDLVTSAFWVKYPNPLQPHVVRIDTLARDMDNVNQRYRSLRLMTLNYNVPHSIEKLFGLPSAAYGVEETTCDFKEKTLTLRSVNVTFSRFFEVLEVCQYKPHPANPKEWTWYTQHAEYRIRGLGLLSQWLEGSAFQAASEKARRGLEAMHNAIHRLEQTDWYRQLRECKSFGCDGNHDSCKQSPGGTHPPASVPQTPNPEEPRVK